MDIVLDSSHLLGKAFDYYAAAPPEVKPGLKAILMEPVAAEAMVKAGPFLYAHKDLLDPAGLTLLGQFFAYAEAMHWTAYNEQNRSADVVLAVRRELGEKGKFPKPEDDPEPNAELREGGFNWKHPEGEAAPAPPSALQSEAGDTASSPDAPAPASAAK